ncbi:hypothetical protein C0J52_22798 [Blattella germanica]|nr:hypothetical protein C0J52_22798 [Blattella germanica]
MDIENSTSETRNTSSKDDSIEMSATSKSGTNALDTGINVDFTQPGTSRDNDQIPSDNPPSSEHEKLPPVDSSETTSETSERNKTAWSKTKDKIYDLNQLITSDVSKLRYFFNWVGKSRKHIQVYKLQADTSLLLGHASHLSYRFQLLFDAAERVPFSKNTFNFHKMEIIQLCTKIEMLLMGLENQIILLYKKYMYYDFYSLVPLDNDDVFRAAMGYVECVKNKINAVVSCLETLDQPNCLSRAQLNLDLEVISEDRTEIYDPEPYNQYDPEPYNQEDFWAIDRRFLFIGYYVVVLCILIAVIYKVTSKW